MRAKTLKSPSQLETEQRRHVLRVAKELAAVLGADFFRALALHLAGTLKADCVCVAELVHAPADQAQTLAVCLNGEVAENFAQHLAGSVSAQVVADGLVAWGSGVTELFPADSLLQRTQAEGYVGLRLVDSAGAVQGLIAVISSRRLASTALVKSVLEAFAPRAAAELERKRADDLLRQSEERYRAFVTSNTDAMWRIEFEQPIPIGLDEDEQIRRIYEYGYLAECNEALCRMLGAQSPEELIGVRIAQLFARVEERTQEAWLREELRSVIRSGYRFDTVETAPLESKCGKLYRLRRQLGIVEDNELRRIWGTTRDITDLKRTEMSLQASEQRILDVLDSVELLGVILDAQGKVVFCNEYLLRVMHLTKEELVGRHWLDRVDSTAERERWTAALAAGPGGLEAPLHFEGAVLAQGAARLLIAWDIAVLRDEQGAAAGLAAIGKDITHQRALEVQVRRAQKLDSLSRLAGGVAHDFNNLLTIVLGQAERLLTRLKASDPTYPMVVAIDSAAKRCAALTQKLLAVGARQHLQPELIDLNALIAEEETIVRNLIGEAVSFSTHLEPDLGSVDADPVQIRRVLANLATNARDAMPNGGKLVITTSNIAISESAPEPPAGVPPGKYVLMTVADSGVGMTEEVRDRIFDPFFTTKGPGHGSGLGLATVYGIVTQSGGYILVQTKLGAGTIFDIYLPRVEGA